MIDELGAYLQGLGIGTLDVDLFLAGLPDSPDAAAAIAEYPGEEPTWSHSTSGVNTERRRFQLTTRAATLQAAMAKAEEANRALCLVHNTFLSGTWYVRVYPLQSPFPLGRDGNDRSRYACNYRVEKSVSA